MHTPTPHAEQIRRTLIQRAEAYASRSGRSLSHIGEEAVRDSKFIANVKNGSNFTIKTYQRVIDWIDAAERDAASDAGAPAEVAA